MASPSAAPSQRTHAGTAKDDQAIHAGFNM
jgi:hypothetical protein